MPRRIGTCGLIVWRADHGSCGLKRLGKGTGSGLLDTLLRLATKVHGSLATVWTHMSREVLRESMERKRRAMRSREILSDYAHVHYRRGK